jgi:hypothetical protein
MESNIMLYLAVYLVIIGIILLFILSPLSLYLSLRLFRTPDRAKKKILLISLALSIPCLGVLSLPEIFEWNLWAGYIIITLLSLGYCAFLSYKIFKAPLINSIALSFCYGLLNTLLIFGCLFILSFISRDQPLEPEAKEWLSAKPAEIAEADNLYYSLIGFSAEPNVNPHQAGLQCVKEFNEYAQKIAITQKQRTAMPSFPAHCSPKSLSYDKKLDILCVVIKADSLARIRSEQSQFDSLIQKYQFLIDNYIGLAHYSGYSNVAVRGPGSPLLLGHTIIEAHKLFLARTILNYLKEKRSEESLESLQQDMRFQRQNLLRSDNLLFLMVTSTLLERDLYLYSQLLDQDIAEKSFQKGLEIPLLSDKEKDFEKTFQGEFRLTNYYFLPTSLVPESIKIPSGLPGFMQKIFFKPNATSNQRFYFYKNIIDWTRLPADKLTSSKIKTLSPPNFWDVGYNPHGIILFTIATPVPNYSTFIYRLHNLDGLIRLVKIKQLVRHDRIAKDKIDTFLKQDLPYCKNPYTIQPMSWDAKTETLYFMDPLCEGRKVAVQIPFSVK